MSEVARHFDNKDASPAPASHLNLASMIQHGAELALRSSSACTAALPALALIDAQDTMPRLAREGELITRSMVGGAIKEAEKDPGGTALKAAAAIGVGAVLGVAATAASPVIAGTALAVGIAGTGAWLWSTFNTFDAANNERNKVVAQAVQQTWTCADRTTLDGNVGRLESKLGKDTLDLGLGLLSGATAGGASKFIPGIMCRELPSVGFKFFSQTAIGKAFPQRSREFEIADMQPLDALRSGEPVQVLVREILGQNKSGPEKSILIGHNLGSDTKLPQTDLLATCRPDLLEPLVRIKSILQHAADVELQIDAAAKRLRFLTLDKQQSSSASDMVASIERFTLGKESEQPFSTFMNELQIKLRNGSLPEGIANGLAHHSLREIANAFAHLPYKIESVKGAGAESIVFELAKDNDAAIFAEEGIRPCDVVLKVSDPKYAAIDDVFGMRPFDAKRYGEFEYGKHSNYVASLQEKAEPIGFDEVDEAELLQLLELIDNKNYTFYDQHGDHQQLGYTKDGRLVVIDWFAVLRKQLCERPEELEDDFKPSR